MLPELRDLEVDAHSAGVRRDRDVVPDETGDGFSRDVDAMESA